MEQKLTKKQQALVARYDAKVVKWFARGREANFKLGKYLLRVKKILGHGRFLPHVEKVYAPHGLKIRTIDNYMRLARDARKLAKLTNLIPPQRAADPQAVAIQTATKQVEAATEAEQPSVVGWSYPRTMTVVCTVKSAAQEFRLRRLLSQFQRVEVRRGSRAA